MENDPEPMGGVCGAANDEMASCSDGRDCLLGGGGGGPSSEVLRESGGVCMPFAGGGGG